MPSEGTAEEVHEEENDGYNYEEDDFEVRLRLSSSCCKLWMRMHDDQV